MGKILLIGDSITHYVPNGMIGNSGDVVYNRGIENIGVEAYRKYALPYTEYRYADVIIVLIGVNNILRPDCDYDNKETLEDLIEKYKNLINDILNGSKGKLIVESIYPTKDLKINQNIEYVNSILSKYCKENDIAYVNVYDELLCDGVLNKKYSHDGLHPNMDGYKIISNKLNKKIDSFRNNKR